MTRVARKIFQGLMLIWATTAPVWSQAFMVRMSGGMTQGRGVIDTLEAPEAYRSDVVLGERRSFGWGEELQLEFGVFITPRICLSLGTGYARFTAPGEENDFLAPEYEKFYAIVPAFKCETTVFSLSAAYSLPLHGGVSAHIKAGTAYTIGSLQSDAVWDSRHPILDRQVRVAGDAKAWGFHFGGGFDVPLSEFLALSLEALYRILDFRNFGEWLVQDGHPNLGDKNEYYFPEYAYEIKEVSLTGLSLQLGLKLRF